MRLLKIFEKRKLKGSFKGHFLSDNKIFCSIRSELPCTHLLQQVLYFRKDRAVENITAMPEIQRLEDQGRKV